MQYHGLTRLLWLTSLVTVPVPYFAVERGYEPVARLLVFATITSAAALSDPDFAAGMFAGLFVLQAFGYAGLLYAGARVLGRRLSAIASGPVRRGLLAAVLVALLGLGLSGAFVMPFARSGSRGSVLDLLD
jgi:hypothetical protein